MKSKAILLFAASVAAILPANAEIKYWDGSTDLNWNTVENWSTASGSATPDPLAVPGAADDVVFNISALNAATTITTALGNNATPSSGISANSLTFNNTDTTTLRSSSNTARPMLLGAGGITVAANAGAANLGGSSNTLVVYVNATQTWTNNSTSVNNASLRLHNAVNGPSGPGAATLTVSNTSTGGTTFSNTLNDASGGGALALRIDSSGSGIVSFNGGTYSGGTTIVQGILNQGSTGTTGNNIGAGLVTLAAIGNNSATLRLNNANAYANSFNITGAGTNKLEMTGTSGTLDGNFNLTGNLEVGVRASGGSGATINGDISGSGNLVKTVYLTTTSSQILTLTGNITTTGNTIINNGAFTLSDTSEMTFHIGANTVSNSLTGTSTGAVSLNGTFAFDLTNAVAANGNSWQVVNTALNETYGVGFKVAGFSQNGTDWTSGGYTFSQTNGMLSYMVPEPSSAMLGAMGMLVMVRRRRA